MVEMQPVESSNIEAIGYDELEQALYVTFHSSGAYRYTGVSLETYNELMEAPSKGRYLAENIKGRYSYEKI